MAGPDFEADAGGSVAIEHEAPVPQDPVYEIGRSAVQGHHLNRGGQQPLEGRFDRELGRLQRRRRVRREEDAYVDVAIGPSLAARHAAVEVDGERAPRVVLEEGLETGFHVDGVHVP